jgi:peptidoglycan/xylan/chitin deacetylase (PgdA/CDA1 family)
MEVVMDALRYVSARAVKLSAAAFDRLAPRRRGITILVYHRVGGDSGGAVDLPASLFASQMAALAGRVVGLDSALDLLASGTSPEADPVVVTFDDGTADFAEHAMTTLDHCRIPATIFVATAFVDEGRTFPDGGRPLSWSALADARATGLITVGSHTHDHLLLDRVDAITAAEQLDRSIGLIRDKLGTEASHFAYPKALAPPPPVEQVVRARFRSASLAGTRPNRYGATDPYRLSRSPVQNADGTRWFERKASGGMVLEDSLRELMSRRRYRGATT